MSLLRHIRDRRPDEKTLVFSEWTSFLDLIEIPLRREQFDFLRYDGTTPLAERDEVVKEFQQNNDDDDDDDDSSQQQQKQKQNENRRGGSKIMLVSLHAGNAGLNLTATSRVVILEPFWNPYVEDRAVDRAHRLGQKRRVKVYRILVPATVEDRILATQKRKKLVDEALGEGWAVGMGRLGVKELRELFGMQSR